MPSMTRMARSALVVLSALGIAGVPGAGVQGQWPTTSEEQASMARARAALELAQARGPAASMAMETEAQREALDRARAGLEAARESMPAMEEALARAAVAERVSTSVGAGRLRFGALPPEPWLQQDPAAKSYQAAREAVLAGRYAEAAKAFAALRSTYPTSGYVPDSYYWQAFALYRVGGTGGLKSALELLSTQKEKYPKAQSRSDAEGLRVRLESQLARQGDAAAAESVAQQASDPCKSDEQSVRLAALSALMNMNAEQAVPILKEVLKSRDTCSAQVRKQAVFLVAQKMSDESVGILLDLAYRNPDPDPEVREQAVFWLSQVHSDEAVAALQSILKNSTDEAIQEKAIFALSQQGSEVSRPNAQGLRRAQRRARKAPGDGHLLDRPEPEGRGRQVSHRPLPTARNRCAEREGDLQHRTGQAARSAGVAPGAGQGPLREPGRSQERAVLGGAVGAVQRAGAEGPLCDPHRAGHEEAGRSSLPRNPRTRMPWTSSWTSRRRRRTPNCRKTAVFWLGQSKDPRVAEFLLSLIRG